MTTMTIRTDEKLREALRRRAEAQGKTASAVAREILEENLENRTLESRAGRLKGRLDLEPEVSDPWRREIRERSWRT